MLCPILTFQNLLEFSISNKFQFQTFAKGQTLKLTLFHDNLLMIPIRLNNKKNTAIDGWDCNVICPKMNKLLSNVRLFALVCINWQKLNGDVFKEFAMSGNLL